MRPGDQGATLPGVFPALLKPNTGDSSQGITKDAVVHNERELLAISSGCGRNSAPRRAGAGVPDGLGISVSFIGNSRSGLESIADPEVDYSRLSDNLPQILGYESKWQPDSPY
ncbi:MAG: hypothetical protein R3D67_20330 [Hyphomicrobiaceae bacterium]